MSLADTPPAAASPATTADGTTCEGFLLVISEFGRIIYVSQSVLQQVGFAPSDLTGHSWFSLLHPDDQIHARAHLKHAVTKCTSEGGSRRLLKSSSLNDIRRHDQEKPDAKEEQEIRRILKARLVQGSRGPSWQPSSSCATTARQDEANTTSSLHSTSDGSFSYRAFSFTGAARKIKHSASQDTISDLSSLSTRFDLVWVGLGTPSFDSSTQPIRYQSPPNTVDPASDISSLSNHSSTSSNPSAASPSASSPLTHFVVRHDLNGRITWVDDRCRVFTGYGAEDLIGTTIFDHLSREDVPYLQLQYDRLKTQQSESIAAVYRFKYAILPTSNGRSEDAKYVYLNCRAYLALNPSTFLLDQIACLAAAETEDEGHADILRQIEELKRGNSISTQDTIKLTMTSCSLEHLIQNDAQHVVAKNSPIQSPDSSNIHPVSPQSDAISDTSSSSPANAVGFHQQAQNGTVGVHQSQVAVIDSQSSPPKSTSSESSDTTKQKRPRSKSGQHEAQSQVSSNDTHVPMERSDTEPHAVNERANESSEIGSEKHSLAQPNNPSVFHNPNQSLQNSSPNLYSMLADPDRPANSSHPEGIQRGMDVELQQGNPQNMANNMFHRQLKEKHRYLEESIRNQGNHLQMLQQKLMQLAEQAAGIYPVEIQLQRPLHRVMELQGKFTRHRDQTHQQRAQVDIATRVVPNRSLKLSNGGEASQRASRRQTPNNPPRPSSVSVSSLNRKSSLPGTNTDTPVGLPANNNGNRQHQDPQTTDRSRSASSLSLPSNGLEESDHNNTAQYSRIENALSPPFVDMTSAPKDGPSDNRFLPDLDTSNFNDDLLSMPYMSADFEDKLSELEMLFSPDFNFSSDPLQQHQLSQRLEGSPAVNRAPSTHNELLNAGS